jgi:hypothetical protein
MKGIIFAPTTTACPRVLTFEINPLELVWRKFVWVDVRNNPTAEWTHKGVGLDDSDGTQD